MKSPRDYICNDCGLVLDKKIDFLQHRNIHSGETPFMCTSCNETFGFIKQYINHFKSVHPHSFGKQILEDGFKSCLNKSIVSNDEDDANNKLPYICSECSKTFGKIEDYKSHLNGHLLLPKVNNNNVDSDDSQSNSTKYNCNICNIEFKSVKEYRAHKKGSHNFICKNCSKNFSTNEKLSKHTCFISASDENFRCSCSRTFTKVSLFKHHIGSKPFSCCSCSMQFNTMTNLIRHIRTHTKQKPYVCQDCGRGFSQSAHLRNHLSIHLGNGAIKCNECNFSCKTFNGLLKHKKKHKEGTINHQNYIDGRKRSTNTSFCNICNKQFLFKRNMGMHMKIHSNKTSLCTECGKVFDSKSKLTSHYKACHKEPSVCKICGKIFASAVLLSAHEKIHVSDKLFSCSVCQKKFSIKNYLVQHMKTHSSRKQFSCSKCGKLFKVAVSLKYHSNVCTSLKIPLL